MTSTPDIPGGYGPAPDDGDEDIQIGEDMATIETEPDDYDFDADDNAAGEEYLR